MRMNIQDIYATGRELRKRDSVCRSTKIISKCLKCKKQFKAESRYNRFCYQCQKANEDFRSTRTYTVAPRNVCEPITFEPTIP